MGALNKIKLGVAGLAVVGGAGYAGYEYMTGEAELHVVAPQESGITVTVGGKEVAKVAAGTHGSFNIAQGEHEIELANDDGDAHKVSANVDSGFYEALIPSTPEQCFADLDVYETFYGKTNPPTMPDLDGTHGADTPISVSGSHYYNEANLPNEIQEDSGVNLMQAIPCELVGKSKDEVNEHLGFTTDNLKRLP